MVESIITYLQQSFGDMYFEDGHVSHQKPKLSPDSDKNHIFYALLSYNSDKNNNKLRFTYLYSLHQKLLRASLLREWHLAEHFKQKIELEDHFYGETEFSKTSMLSIRDPAIAFYFYHLKKDYDAALKYMTSSLLSIDILINDGFTDGMFMKIEQFLNTFRVHYNAGNYNEAAYYAKRVFSYVAGNEVENFQFPLRTVIRSTIQLHEILHLYINSIISKSIKNGGDNEVNEAFLSAALADVQVPKNQEIEPLFLDSFDLVKSFLTNTKEQAFENLFRTNIFDVKVPVYIQYYFILTLTAYPGVTEAASVELLSRIGKYQKSILKLGNLGKKIALNQENVSV